MLTPSTTRCVQVMLKQDEHNENKSRGFGFVTYEFKDEAARAIQQLNGGMIDKGIEPLDRN